MIASTCRALIFFILWFLISAAAEAAKARSAPAEANRDTALTAPLSLDRAAIEKRLALVATTELSAAQREWTSSTLMRALDALAQIASLEAKVAYFENQAKTATTQTVVLRRRLEQLADEPAQDISTTASSSSLLALIAQAEAEMAQRQKALAEIQAERNQRQKRLAEIPQDVAAAKQELERLEKGESIAPAPEGASWEPLRQVALEATRKAAERKVAQLEAERAALEATRELTELREEEAQLLLSRATEHLKALQAAQALARQREAHEAVEQARRALWQTANSHPLVQAVAADNEFLARRRTGPEGTTARIQQITQNIDNLKSLQEQVRKRFDSLRKRLELLGRTPALGQVMRKERDSLPDLRELERNLRAYSDEMAKVQAELLDLRDKQAQLSSLDQRLRGILQHEMRLTADQTSAVVQSLITQRRSFVTVLVAELDDLFAKLAEATTLASLVQKDTQEFARFLDEHILWVRSSAPYTLTDVVRAGQALATLVSRDNLVSVVLTLRRDIASDLFLYVSVCVFLGAVLYWKRRTTADLAEFPQQTLTTRETFRVALYLGIDAITPEPLVLAYIGQRLRGSALESGYLDGVGNGLIFASLFLVMRRLAQWLGKVFDRSAHNVFWRRLGRAISLLAWIGAVAAFTIQLANSALPVLSADSLERTVFVAGMLSLSLFGATLALSLLRYRAEPARVWAWRTSRRWAIAVAMTCFALGLLLAALSLLGFQYSATQILIRALRSLVLLAGGYSIWWLIQRWLTHLARTHGIFESLTSGVKEKIATPKLTSGRGESSTHALSLAQTRRLLSALVAITIAGFLWLVWVDVLPAMALVTRIALWKKGDAAADGMALHVTLGDLLLALVVVAVTIAFLKNVPGLIELLFLRRTHIDRGTRYAIAALVRYALIIFGLIESSRLLGLTWKSVQWMAAAITVGLGFGLQEIFANFVSGLILLFERPVRVGDWITVAGTTGVVTDIRTRATIIRDPDGKDLIIPNKQLITASVMNWTLSGPGTRLVFDVRTDAATKVEEVRRILLEVAQTDSRVARNPAPLVLMEAVAAAEHRYRLYLYSYAIEDRLMLKDRLIQAIRQAFAERGITLSLLECPIW